jgi:SAM-dependent methyltransferase
MYNVEGFLRDPSLITLGTEERQLLNDVSGLKLIHLQCAFGLDSLSWARLGAQVVGLDNCKKSIAAARELAIRTNLDATFFEEDLNTCQHLKQNNFDVAYVSYGALDWIADLPRYFELIRNALSPHGKFVLAEVHPIAKWWLRRQGNNTTMNPSEGPIQLNGHSYAGGDVGGVQWAWRWSLVDILDALLQAGFELAAFTESTSSSYRFHHGLILERNGRWTWPRVGHGLPLTFATLAMRKQHE